MGDLGGRSILVTGANTGIGRATALQLAARGARLWLTARSEAKIQTVLEVVRAAGARTDFIALDLADLASVRAAATAFLAQDEPLHVLVNNAGLAGHRGVTKDGFELQFGVNHLGPFLLTALLLPRLLADAPARVVNVSSRAHYRAKRLDFAKLRGRTRGLSGFREYGVSKLCNVLFTRELARRYGERGLTSYALHPGVIASDIWRRLPWPVQQLAMLRMSTVEEGARPVVRAATAADVGAENGGYLDVTTRRWPSRLAQQDALARRLWDLSSEWTGATLPAAGPP
jgi:retinol dehydrogenase 12